MAANDEQVLKALIYRSAENNITCDGCPETIRQNLLSASTVHRIETQFIGPDSCNNVTFDTPDVLKDVALLVFPGGDSLPDAWNALKSYNDMVRDWVSNGGRYLGICLGAYLAGPEDGFNLLPEGNKVFREIEEPDTQVEGMDNAVIQLYWTFQTGSNQSKTQEQWVFFQDGAAFSDPNTTDLKVLGRYTHNNNVSATLSQFGEGFVGLVGFHPEADDTWYANPSLVNPSGIQFDIGADFLNATLNGNTPNLTFVSDVPYKNASSGSTSSSSPTPTSGVVRAVPAADPHIALILLCFSWVMALF